MHYTPSVDLAFVSVEHIMRDVNYGWLIRYLHANTASFFFIFVYLHVARGLYYGSYKSPRILVWSIGVIILVLMMAIAFLGYTHSLKWYNITTEINLIYNNNLYTMFLPSIIATKRTGTILNSYKVYPKAVFVNLHTINIKYDVNEFIKPLAGVYIIINLINENIYVGSAITGRMPNRFHKHLYGLTGSSLVAAAVEKYGLENFAFIVVDTVNNVVTQEDNKILLEMEDYYINLLMPKYNIAPQAGNTFGIKHTENTRANIRANYSSERREFIGSLNRGKTLSPITVGRIRTAALARPPMSMETRDKISINSTVANLYIVNHVEETILSNGITSIVLRTIPKVAEFCNCSEKTVRRALQGNGIIKNTWKIVVIN